MENNSIETEYVKNGNFRTKIYNSQIKHPLDEFSNKMEMLEKILINL